MEELVKGLKTTGPRTHNVVDLRIVQTPNPERIHKGRELAGGGQSISHA